MRNINTQNKRDRTRAMTNVSVVGDPATESSHALLTSFKVNHSTPLTTTRKTTQEDGYVRLSRNRIIRVLSRGFAIE
jgi:hypothetical protein